jgi:hypothetical protein
MKDQILNVAAEQVQAAASFEFRGWNVSMSTITRSGHVEVLVWDNNGTNRTFSTVEEAINFVLFMTEENNMNNLCKVTVKFRSEKTIYEKLTCYVQKEEQSASAAHKVIDDLKRKHYPDAKILDWEVDDLIEGEMLFETIPWDD